MSGTDSRITSLGALRLRQVLVALFLFGVSFGYVEAAIVTYLRAIYDPMRQRIHPELNPGELVPLIQFHELKGEGVEHVRRLATEIVREAVTLGMLVAMATAVARNLHQWFAAFMICFGLWDIFYYVFLKVLIDWPASLLAWDILFLIPVPWIAPVISPVIVALSMIAAGVVILWRESVGRPVVIRWFHWLAIIVGGLVIIAAFCWDFRNTTAGHPPNPFNWPVFLLGEGMGVVAFVHSLVVSRHAVTKMVHP